MGLLVWQDMPSTDGRVMRGGGPDLTRPAAAADQFRSELRAMIDLCRNSPSVVMWVPFNEGWGQFETAAMTQWIKAYDPTRLVNSASGWADRGVGDVRDIHSYSRPRMASVEADRASVLGEFGGLGLPLEGHLWWNKKNWGYCNMKTRAN